MNGASGQCVARRLEQVEGAVGVDAEVGLRLARRPVVRRLRGGVDDDLDRAARARRTAARRRRRRGCRARRERNSAASVVEQLCGRPARSRPRARRTGGACRSRCRPRRSPARPGARTDSEPISPPDPVTMTVAISWGPARAAGTCVRGGYRAGRRAADPRRPRQPTAARSTSASPARRGTRRSPGGSSSAYWVTPTKPWQASSTQTAVIARLRRGSLSRRRTRNHTPDRRQPEEGRQRPVLVDRPVERVGARAR